MPVAAAHGWSTGLPTQAHRSRGTWAVASQSFCMKCCLQHNAGVWVAGLQPRVMHIREEPAAAMNASRQCSRQRQARQPSVSARHGMLQTWERLFLAFVIAFDGPGIAMLAVGAGLRPVTMAAMGVGVHRDGA